MIGAVRHVSRHFTAYACLAYGIAAGERIAQAVLAEGPYYEMRSRLMTQFFVNYADHGFAKRATVGTIVRPVTGALETPEHFVFWLMVALNLAALAATVMLTQRYLPHREEGGDGVAILRCALAVGSLGVMQIAHDLGRYDPVVLALLACAVALAARRRIWATMAVCAVAILTHEAFAIYGAPLVLAVAWIAVRRASAPGFAARRIAPLAAGLVMVSLAVLFYGNSDRAARLAHGDGGYVWLRGIIEFGGPLGPVDVVILAVYWTVLLLVYLDLSEPARPLLVLAALCPLALNLFGIDHARWLTLGFYAILINLAVQARAFGHRQPDLTPGLRRAGYLLCLPLGPMGVVEPIAWLP